MGTVLLGMLVLAGVFWLFQSATQGRANPFAGLFGGGRARVGLVAGHWGHDSGAVCPDGLSEADINRDVAERTAVLLRRAGYRVDLMGEFDPALSGYEADVFLSIHTDSCIEELSGFKIARLPENALPAETDRFVETLYREYAAVTGLQPHYDTITYDMREYHAFHEISPMTPGAIIEIGFMGGDRELLTKRPDLVARGIARGIMAYMDGPPATDSP